MPIELIQEHRHNDCEMLASHLGNQAEGADRQISIFNLGHDCRALPLSREQRIVSRGPLGDLLAVIVVSEQNKEPCGQHQDHGVPVPDVISEPIYRARVHHKRHNLEDRPYGGEVRGEQRLVTRSGYH